MQVSFLNLCQLTRSRRLVLDWACLTYFAVAEAAWETGDKWDGATEASNDARNEGGVATGASGLGGNEGGDNRTCRL